MQLPDASFLLPAAFCDGGSRQLGFFRDRRDGGTEASVAIAYQSDGQHWPSYTKGTPVTFEHFSNASDSNGLRIAQRYRLDRSHSGWGNREDARCVSKARPATSAAFMLPIHLRTNASISERTQTFEATHPGLRPLRKKSADTPG